MKILLTGTPKSGKSTLLSALVEGVTDKQGFFTEEVRQDGVRTGFAMCDASGHRVVLAQTTHQTQYQVGRFFVATESLNAFFEPLNRFGPSGLLYIDEIGQMQLFHTSFKQLAEQYITAKNDFVGTITSVYSDSFTKNILQNTGIIVCNLTIENRDAMRRGLEAALLHRATFNMLPERTQSETLLYANAYLNSEQHESFYKLFNNALKYVTEGKVSKLKADFFEVKGDTSRHIVRLINDAEWVCDCPLFKGEGKFLRPAECSHIQAVKLTIC